VAVTEGLGNEHPHEARPPAAARVASVSKAARVLRTFEPERRLLSTREIAERTGISRSTCHAICSTLVAEGLLELVPGGGFRLGAALAEMGGQVIERTGLVEAAGPSMDKLSRATGGEVHLGQLVSGYIVYLTRVEHERHLSMRNRMGLRVPADVTGCGKAALSALPRDQARELVRARAGGSSVDLDALEGELEEVRARGYVISESFQAAFTSVAAPLRGPGGAVVGGLSSAHPRGYLRGPRLTRVATEVQAAAGVTSERLQTLHWRG
jgi:DNA-binding IclR family transcriptional regulator